MPSLSPTPCRCSYQSPGDSWTKTMAIPALTAKSQKGVYRWSLSFAHVSRNLVHFNFNHNLQKQKGWPPCFRFFMALKDCQVCYWISTTSEKKENLACAQGGLCSLSTTISLISESSSVLMTWSFTMALTSSDCFSSLNDFSRKGLEIYID